MHMHQAVLTDPKLVSELHDLRVLLASESVHWARAFISGGGVAALCNLLEQAVTRPYVQESDLNVAQALLRCLRAVMSDAVGMGKVLGLGDGGEGVGDGEGRLWQLALVLNNRLPRCAAANEARCAALELLVLTTELLGAPTYYLLLTTYLPLTTYYLLTRCAALELLAVAALHSSESHAQAHPARVASFRYLRLNASVLEAQCILHARRAGSRGVRAPVPDRLAQLALRAARTALPRLPRPGAQTKPCARRRRRRRRWRRGGCSLRADADQCAGGLR